MVITGRELAEAYRLETDQIPGEGVLMQLQRLPGLTERDQDPGARSFIDEDMLAALQGSAMARFILGDFRGLSGRNWLAELPDKGIAMASYLLREAKADSSTAIATCLRAAGGDARVNYDKQVISDSLAIALEMAREEGQIDCRGVVIEDATIGTIDLEDMLVKNLVIRDSIINNIVLGPEGATSSLRISRCSIRRVSGIASEQGLPPGMFVDCDIQEFDDMSTNSSVLKSNLPPQVKALVTVLRKLYVQSGSGRRINALKRGISHTSVINAIDDVLKVLESEQMVTIINQVAHPIRRQKARVLQILSAPNLSNDPIVLKVKEILTQ